MNPCIRENIILKSFTGVLELRTKSTGNVRGMQISPILRHLLPAEGLGATSQGELFFAEDFNAVTR